MRHRHDKKPKIDIAANMNATDMSEDDAERGAWFGLCLSLAPLVIIGLILVLQHLG